MISQDSQKIARSKCPSGNTGCNSQDDISAMVHTDSSVGAIAELDELDYSITPFIHWIQCTIRSSIDLLPLIKQILSVTFDEWTLMEYGTRKGITFHNLFSGTGGSQIAFNLPSQSKSAEYHYWISVSGTSCERAGLKNCFHIIRQLNSLSETVNWTRTDSKVRLGTAWQNEFTLDDLKAIIDEKETIRNWVGPISAHYQFHVENYTDYQSQTLYFGSTGSDKMTRFYDPFDTHGCHGMDIEAQLKDTCASTFVGHLLDLGDDPTEQEIAMIVSSTALGQVAFIDRSKSLDHAYRCPNLPWWEKLLNSPLSYGALRIASIKLKPSLERTKVWFKKQVAVSAAMLVELNPEFFWEVISEAFDRFTPFHHSLMNEYRKIMALSSS
jgi:hypothetical protein